MFYSNNEIVYLFALKFVIKWEYVYILDRHIQPILKELYSQIFKLGKNVNSF